MTEVFVSYKRENLAAVNRLVEALRAEGIGVWWDQDIPPNAAWEATIERALAEARLVVVAWSPASVASENVKAEARWARGQGRLLQVFVEACEPPLFFGERQGIDLKGWSGAPADPAFRSLVAAARRGLAAPSADRPPGASPGPDAAPLPLPSKPSIAIVPFANLSGDPEQDYFADGMVEEIAGALSRFKSLFVIGGRSGLSFKGQRTSSQDAARALGVRYVLEGSVRKAGGRVRVAAKLIDGESGEQVWSERFDDTLEDIFDLQDRVALTVAGVIAPAVREAETRRTIARPTSNPTSYDLFLRGQARYRALTKGDLFAAISLFDAAVALDPDFAQALAYSAVCHGLIMVYGWAEDPERHHADTVRQIRRAIESAGDDPDALALASSAALTVGDLAACVALAGRAVVLNPGSSIARTANAWACLTQGDAKAALTEIETALRLDPLSTDRPLYLGIQGLALACLGRFEAALAPLNESRRLRPWPLSHALTAVCAGWVGDGPASSEALASHRALTEIPISQVIDRLPVAAPMSASLREGLARAERLNAAGVAG
ncbi:MAG TPA: TIR domain-containing protein [Caulobacteraceae bacterium]|nr:TIR domain-containing protein [Caulobacteraceae bacterium]